jgi:hypothetical protein
MKTVNDINKEILSIHKLLVEAEKNNLKKSKKKVLSKKLSWYNHIRLYLETKPREEFVREELETVMFRIARINADYIYWSAGRSLTAYKDPKKTYTNEMGLPVLNEQLKTLKYILEK